MSAPKSFDLTRVFLYVSGTLITGFQDGDAITASREANDWDDVAGSDAAVQRFKTNDPRGTITIRLQGGEAANAVLNALAEIDALLGSSVFPVVAVDGNGTTVVESAYTWVQKRPDWTVGRQASPIEWMLRSSDLKIQHGIIAPSGGF